MAFTDKVWYVKDNGTVGWTAVTAWAASATVAAGAWRRQLATPTVGNERCFVAIVGGTTGGTEPTWVVTRGGKTTDNTVTWQECTGMAGPNEATQTNAPTWTTVKNTSVSLGEVIYDSGSSSLQIGSTAGTAGNGSTPAFSGTAGTTTADNTVTWTSLGATSNYTGWQYPHSRMGNAFATNWGAAGNTFYISNNHAETQAAAINISPPSSTTLPSKVICVSDAAAPPTAGATTASVTTTGANALAYANSAITYCYTYGIIFNSGTGANNSLLTIGGGQGGMTLENCAMNNPTTNAAGFTNGLSIRGTPLNLVCINCTFSVGSTTNAFVAQQGFVTGWAMIGGSICATGSVPTTPFTIFNNTAFVLSFRGVDLSVFTGTLYSNSGGAPFSIVNLEDCKLGAGVTIAGSMTNFGYLKAHSCDSSSTNYRYYFANGYAVAQQETTITRSSSSATDGTTRISWSIASTSSASIPTPFVSEDVAQWSDLTSGSRTATFYVTTNTTLTNADFWAELETLGTSGSPLGVITTSRSAPVVTAVALASDGSTWGGSTTNKYKIVLTYTAVNKGPVKARFYLAKPSVTVYVDPYIYIA